MATISLRLENRTIESDDSTVTVFQLRAAVTGRTGDIDPAVFVIRIDDFAEDDQFERVAVLADLSDILVGRTNAVVRGDSFYRVSNFDIEYADFETASTGKTAITDAVNVLVNDFNEFTDSGNASTTVVDAVITGADQTFLENLQAQYTTATENVAAQEAESDSQQLIIDRLSGQIADQAERINNLVAARDATLEAFRPFYQLQITQYDTIAGFAGLSPGELAQVQGYSSAASAALNAINSNIADIDSQVADERVQQETFYQDLEAATQAQAQAEAIKSEEQAKADRLLAAILEIDPDFTG